MALEFEKRSLFIPDKQELVKNLQSGLLKSFKQASVLLVDCPDLSQEPFNLSTKGICGSPSIADIGGVPNLMPTPIHKIYNLKDIAMSMGYQSKNCSLIGAGAAPSHLLGNLAELITDISIDNFGNITNSSHIAQINTQTDCYELRTFNTSCEAKHLVNIFSSEGNSGKVIEIRVKWRTGTEGFIQCLQRILFESYGEKCVALGGVFLLQKGLAKIHVMPAYSKEPLVDTKMINDWLRFFEMKAPLTCLGYLVSYDPGMKLRLEHFHCFGKEGQGGHFHHDVSSDDAEYLAYFSVPEYIYRFDPV